MKRSGGFTLVELLVALAITAILIVLLSSVVAATLGAWNQGRNRLDTFSTARQLLGRLSDELKGATVSPSMSGGQIQFVENASLASVPVPTAKTAENVFFVAPYPNLGAGDLCTIAYALDADTHELKRALRASDNVWADAPANRYQVGGYAYVPADWHTIATGVLQFELQCYSQNDLDNNLVPDPTWDSKSPSDPNMTGNAPRRIVVRLQVVDDRTVKQLAGMPPGPNYDAIVLRSARQFLADVLLPTK